MEVKDTRRKKLNAKTFFTVNHKFRVLMIEKKDPKEQRILSLLVDTVSTASISDVAPVLFFEQLSQEIRLSTRYVKVYGGSPSPSFLISYDMPLPEQQSNKFPSNEWQTQHSNNNAPSPI